MMMDFHVKLHHLIHIKRDHPAGDRHAHGVAYEVAGVMIAEEHRVAGKYGTLFRFFHIAFDGNRALFPGFCKQVEHHLEGVDIPLLGKRGSFDDTHEAGDHFLQDVHRVGRQHGSNGRAAYGDQLGGLDEDGKFALLHEETTDDAGKYK